MRKVIFIIVLTCACIPLQAQISTIKTIAGCDTFGFSGDGGLATNATLFVDEGICLDNRGNLYIADAFNFDIRKVELATGIISTIAGIDSAGFGGDGGLAINSILFVPVAVFTDLSGNIYIADAGNNRIRKIDVSTGIITTIAGSGPTGITTTDSTGDGGPATNAHISNPSGICLDKFGNIYIADEGNNKIRKVESGTGIITTFAGIGTPGYTIGYVGYSGDGGPATNAQFSGAAQCYADTNCNIFICDIYNHVIRKVDAITRIITTIAGTGTAGYSGDGGLAINAQLNQPGGIYIDNNENIYIADYWNGAIRKIDGATGIISKVAGTGTRGFSGDGGPATTAMLRCSDVFVDKNGVIYIADEDNNRVRMVYNTAMGVETSPRPSPEERVLYPNPATDELHIDNAAGCEVRVLNLLGQEVLSFDRIRMKGNNEILHISGLVAGVYILQIIEPSGEIINKRFIIAR